MEPRSNRVKEKEPVKKSNNNVLALLIIIGIAFVFYKYPYEVADNLPISVEQKAKYLIFRGQVVSPIEDFFEGVFDGHNS